ncbi:hypothetical protein KTO58_19250 [Chitinophaga pendula]|uniref:hypothetical protein n=1 Tax=Chitinophaga TaxID=79328 RepID=UPI000BB0A06D|nr:MULTISPECIES: hypothetical protein [Chitinophaga]ASZ11191.1 hypothetical protein CK934_09560 [Chitinophaga sp. MD30]UCJ05812.1 hypothetical protein KTO58_19250 [Chitinophaga pendula]
MNEPKPRCVTDIAIQTLATELDYPFHANMQDWQYEVAKFDDIEKYLAKYGSTDDDDIRFLLMEMIIETSHEGWSHNWILNVWPRVECLLRKNFLLHEYTVYYWCCFDNENIEDCFHITISMRMLWNEQSGKH